MASPSTPPFSPPFTRSRRPFCCRTTQRLLAARATNQPWAAINCWNHVNDPVARQLVCYLLADLILRPTGAGADEVVNRPHPLLDDPTWRATRRNVHALLDAYTKISHGSGDSGWAAIWPRVDRDPAIVWTLSGMAFETWIPD